MAVLRNGLREELKYHAWKHPILSNICKTVLCIVTLPLCCCCCYYCCFVCGRDGCMPGSHKRKERARMEKEHWERKTQRHLKRRQSLSIDAPVTERTKKPRKELSDQAASPLFSKLPVEVRERIYEYALLGTGAVCWYMPKSRPGIYQQLKSASCLPTGGSLAEIEGDIIRKTSGASGRSLLQTCRLIYTEALPILYCNTEFSFDGYSSLQAFTSITSSSKVRKIRTVRFTGRDWKEDLHFLNDIAFWGNIRTVYVVYYGGMSAPGSHFGLESGGADPSILRTCTYYFLFYGVSNDLDQEGIPRNKKILRWYKYVEKPTASDWSNAEWCAVE